MQRNIHRDISRSFPCNPFCNCLMKCTLSLSGGNLGTWRDIRMISLAKKSQRWAYSNRLWIWLFSKNTYHQTSNINCTLVGNKIVDHLDVVLRTAGRRCSNIILILDWHLASVVWAKATATRDENNYFWIWNVFFKRSRGVTSRYGIIANM